MAVRGLLLWALFKLLQAAVAAVFSFIIVAQACVAGVLRFFGEPAALQRVRAAQLGSPVWNREQGLKAGEKTGNIHIRAVVTDPSTVKPMHIFVDQRKGEEACKLDPWGGGGLSCSGFLLPAPCTSSQPAW